MAYIIGSNNSDGLLGTSEADFILGLAGDDLIIAGSGDDILIGNSGSDTLIGGDGDDTLIDDQGNNLLDGGAGFDTAIINSAGGVTTITNDSIQTFKNSNTDIVQLIDIERVVFNGSTSTDLIGATGFNGTVQINGMGGDDFIWGAQGNSTLLGGEGNDNITALLGNDELSGGNGNDTLKGGLGSDDIRGDAGNDRLIGSSSGVGEVDTLTGGLGSDEFVLGNTSQRLYDDGDPFSSGVDDFALVTDFDSNEDTITLHGQAGHYRLEYVMTPYGAGIGIYRDYATNLLKDELIGVLQGNQPRLDLNTSYFEYVS